jgi:hypothetical protein
MKACRDNERRNEMLHRFFRFFTLTAFLSATHGAGWR